MAARNEVNDFQRLYMTLTARIQLVRSLKRQRRAQLIIRTLRYVHIPLACLALLLIGYHSIVELWKMLILHY